MSAASDRPLPALRKRNSASPPDSGDPGDTVTRFDPNDSMLEVMEDCAPRPMASKTITAVTPMTIPSNVNPARNLLEVSEASAVISMSSGFN